MARFFPHEEIAGRELTPVEDVQWLAGEIARLKPFVEGSAVLCGSVSWGVCSWRSDVDVAHFSTIAHPSIEEEIRTVVTSYDARTQGRFILPRVDVIAIGAESFTSSARAKSISTPAVSTGTPSKKDKVTDVFTETAVVFRDHLGALADLHGDPWRIFLSRYLSSVDGNRPDRRKAIMRYVEAMTTRWARQPLHRLSLGPDGQLTQEQLDLLSTSENYPINLMRRILGELGAYPRPDRASDVREAFSKLDTPWARSLLAQFAPFFTLQERYESIVAACRQSQSPLDGKGYYEQVRSLFIDLPFGGIQSGVSQYLEN